MNIEQYTQMMTDDLRSSPVPSVPGPVSEAEIAKAENSFRKMFGVGFPDSYKRVLRVANGIEYNGLTIWPVKREPLFSETIIQANQEFQEELSDNYLYFAQMEEELYVFDIKTSEYCAIEFVGLPVWKRFSSSEEMYDFMLSRASE